MIFWRAKELLEGGSELFRAEAELVSKRVRRLLISSLLTLTVVLFAITGIVLVTAGVAVSLSEAFGWAPALVSIGAFYGLLCLMTYGIWVIRSSRSIQSQAADPKGTSAQLGPQAGTEPEGPKEAARDAKDRLGNAVSADPGQTGPDQQGTKDEGFMDGIDALKDSAIEVGMKNPVALGSAALLVVSLLGPGKTFKMISRGAAAAGLASTLLDTITPEQDAKPKS